MGRHPNSSTKLHNQLISATTLATSLYSASALDRATVVRILEDHEGGYHLGKCNIHKWNNEGRGNRPN